MHSSGLADHHTYFSFFLQGGILLKSNFTFWAELAGKSDRCTELMRRTHPLQSRDGFRRIPTESQPGKFPLLYFVTELLAAAMTAGGFLELFWVRY
jgi:hypothetical protein